MLISVELSTLIHIKSLYSIHENYVVLLDENQPSALIIDFGYCRSKYHSAPTDDLHGLQFPRLTAQIVLRYVVICDMSLLSSFIERTATLSRLQSAQNYPQQSLHGSHYLFYYH